MHEEEWWAEEVCALCQAEIDPGRDCAFRFAEHGVLCFSCALKRGGSYDAERDHWQVPPRIHDLPEAQRPTH